MSYLVIVESPTKVGTIKGYLGSNYRVIASKGHVRDLPKSTLGVDIENNFEPHYINIRGKGELIRDIRKEAKAATKVFLATDPDREGEAISWHLAAVLAIPVDKIMRVSFNEITKTAVKAAIKSPRPLDMNLVNAQQARRILDRIVGYKISPLLWKNVQSGLSAGRVQSGAERLVVDREREIRAFVAEEYWTVDATLNGPDDKTFVVHYVGDESGKVRLESEAAAMAVAKTAETKPFTVRSVKRSTRTKLPAPPFTTSTMQQEASRKLGFQSQRIMRVAQELYEGINLGPENGGAQGLITYMRTDSLRVSAEAQESARAFISEKYGAEYYPEAPRQYKSKALSQDAHEAIRPARVELEPQKIRKLLTSDQYRLYKLIWDRFVASQMQSATLSVISVDLNCDKYLFRTGGYSVVFPGYMALYEESEDESLRRRDTEPDEVKDARIPDLEEDMILTSEAVDPQQHFTEPPARYNEASLIKSLEEKGIGRPSSYTPIITTILERGYVKRDGKALVPTPLGEVTTGLMEKHFPTIVDYGFTADMETRLDNIEKGETTIDDVLGDFWAPFADQLKNAEETLGSETEKAPVEETDLFCDKCGSRMIVKKGRFGKFAACPNYPGCRSTKPLTRPGEPEGSSTEVVEGMKCELCGGDVVIRSGRFGSFFACANYPQCKFTKPRDKEIGVDCPKCGSPLVSKQGKRKAVFYGCSKYPACDFSSWDLPTKEKCPSCGGMLFRKKGKALLVCHDTTCNYQCPLPAAMQQEDAPTEDNE